MKRMVNPVFNTEGMPAFSIFRRVFFIWFREPGAWDYSSREDAVKTMNHLQQEPSK